MSEHVLSTTLTKGTLHGRFRSTYNLTTHENQNNTQANETDQQFLPFIMQPHEHTGERGGATAYNDLRGRLRAKESCVSGERGLPSVLQKRLPHGAPVHSRKQSLVDVREPLSQEKACDTLCLCVYLLSFSPCRL